MLEDRGLESGRGMAGFALVALELLFVNILVAVGRIARLERHARQPVFDVAFCARDVVMFVGEGKTRLGMVDLGFFPPIRRVAFGAVRFPLMGVLVTGEALVEFFNPVVVIDVAFGAFNLPVFAREGILGGRVVVEFPDHLPSGGLVAVRAFCSQLVVVVVLVAVDAYR